jgi:hypothetical protein
MSFIGCEISGVDELLKDFKGYEVEAGKALDKAIKDTAKGVETDAENRLRGLLGSAKHTIHGGAGLLGSIYNRVSGQFEKIVGTPVYYAPYIEFGTGDLVFENFDFDENARSIASQYKGKQPAKHPIRGDSFLNWAAVNQQKKLVERIENELNKINK